jgi:hypothetical protein
MYSRQKIASFLEQNAGARLGGYVFEQLKDTRNKRATTYYKLTKGAATCST